MASSSVHQHTTTAATTGAASERHDFDASTVDFVSVSLEDVVIRGKSKYYPPVTRLLFRQRVPSVNARQERFQCGG